MPHALLVNVQVSVSLCYVVGLWVHLPEEENGCWWNRNGAVAMRLWFLTGVCLPSGEAPSDVKAGRCGVRAQLVLLCC